MMPGSEQMVKSMNVQPGMTGRTGVHGRETQEPVSRDRGARQKQNTFTWKDWRRHHVGRLKWTWGDPIMKELGFRGAQTRTRLELQTACAQTGKPDIEGVGNQSRGKISQKFNRLIAWEAHPHPFQEFLHTT